MKGSTLAGRMSGVLQRESSNAGCRPLRRRQQQCDQPRAALRSDSPAFALRYGYEMYGSHSLRLPPSQSPPRELNVGLDADAGRSIFSMSGGD
jgi:hypothetical protein